MKRVYSLKRAIISFSFIAAFLFIGVQVLHAATAYSVQQDGNGFVSFDTATPAGQTLITNNVNAGESVRGLDFSPDATVLYGITTYGKFGTIDTTTGSFTFLKQVTGVSDNHVFTGLKIDPTTDVFYLSTSIPSAATSTSAASSLYTLNTATGAATLVGIQPELMIIDLAISADGQIYATDLISDKLYGINKSTGAATAIGLLGYDINQAQGMDFDYATNLLYAALFYGADTQFSTIDVTTGAATEIATLNTQRMEIAIKSPVTSVPEPATLLFLSLGMLGVLGLRRRMHG